METNKNNGLNAEAQTLSPQNDADSKVFLKEGHQVIDGLDVDIDTAVNQFALGNETPGTTQDANTRQVPGNMPNDYQAQDETIHSESNPLTESKTGGLWDAPVIPSNTNIQDLLTPPKKS